MNPINLIIDEIHQFGFHIIEDFLTLSDFHFLQNLIQTQYYNGRFRDAKIGKDHTSSQNRRIRNDQIYWLQPDDANSALQAYFTAVHAIREALNQALFLGLMDFEAHLAVYKPGTFYKKHTDQFAMNHDRRISCVYYLNEEWEEGFGGDLILYDENNAVIKRILPTANRFVCFCSDIAHEVLPTEQMRYSITGWLKSRPMLSP